MQLISPAHVHVDPPPYGMIFTSPSSSLPTCMALKPSRLKARHEGVQSSKGTLTRRSCVCTCYAWMNGKNRVQQGGQTHFIKFGHRIQRALHMENRTWRFSGCERIEPPGRSTRHACLGVRVNRLCDWEREGAGGGLPSPLTCHDSRGGSASQ